MGCHQSSRKFEDPGIHGWTAASATTESKLRNLRNFLVAFLAYGTVSREAVENNSGISTVSIDASIWQDINPLYRATKCRECAFRHAAI